MNFLHFFSLLHGHFGWMSAALLTHPSLLLLCTARPVKKLCLGATSFCFLLACAGLSLYPFFRDRLKREIFISSPFLGYMFERKEHLAFGAVMFAFAGLVLTWRAPTEPLQQEGKISSRNLAGYCYALAAFFTLVSCIIGTLVASYRSF